MGVTDGQAVDQAITNPAFINKNVNDVMPNILGFNQVSSGLGIANIQQAVNNLYTATGVFDTSWPGTVFNATAGTISNGQSFQTCLTTLANKFDASTGHHHSGTAGDGPLLTSTSVAYTPASTAQFYQGSTIGGCLNALNQYEFGSRASPQNVAASGGLALLAGVREQDWFVQGLNGAIGVTGSSLMATTAGFLVGQVVNFIGCSDTNPITLGGVNFGVTTNLLLTGPITLGLTPASGNNVFLSTKWDGSNLQERFRA